MVGIILAAPFIFAFALAGYILWRRQHVEKQNDRG